MTVSGVLFDVGGTLIRSNGARFEVENARAAAQVLCSRFPLAAPKPLWRELLRLRRTFPKEGEGYRQLHTTRWALLELARRHGLRLDATTLERAERAFVMPEVRGSVPLPGITEVVKALTGKTKLAVVSNTRSHLLIEEIVKRLRLHAAFDPFVTSAGCGWRKPSPRIFQHVVRRWGVPTDQLVMIGDSPTKDVAGAKALGVRAIWLQTDGPRGFSCNADAVIDAPADILDVLTSWGLETR